MMKKTNWVAGVSIIALVLAVVAVAVVLKGGMTGDAIFSSSNWKANVQNLSFESSYQMENGTNRPVVILKIPNVYRTGGYILHSTTSVTYKNLSNDDPVDHISSINPTGIGFNFLCREDSTPGFCDIYVAREYDGYYFKVYTTAYIINKRGTIVAAGIYSPYYRQNDWARLPYERKGVEVF